MEFQDSFVFWLLVIVALMGMGTAGAFLFRRIMEKSLGRWTPVLMEIQPVPKPHSQDGKSMSAYPVSPRRARAPALAVSGRSSGISALPFLPPSARLGAGVHCSGLGWSEYSSSLSPVAIRITMMPHATGLCGRFSPFGRTGMGVPPVAGEGGTMQRMPPSLNGVREIQTASLPSFRRVIHPLRCHTASERADRTDMRDP